MSASLAILAVCTLALSVAAVITALAGVAVAGHVIAGSCQERRRLTHRETAAVEDAIVLAAALAVQVGTVLHILRRGPDAYPVDLPAGALWRAAVEALEREGHLTLTETQAGANGQQDTP